MINFLYIYFVLTFLIFFILKILSTKFNFLDIPSERKIHKLPVPYTGGLALYICLILQIFFTSNIENISNINLIILFSLTLLIIGLADDKYNLKPLSRLCMQIFAIIYFIIFADIKIIHIGILFDKYIYLGKYAIIFTLISSLVIINSLNYLDGIDGSAIGIFINNIILLIYFSGNYDLLSYLVLPSLIFVLFNYSFLKLPKFFLGNSGVYMLGFILSFIIIEHSFFNQNYDISINEAAWILSFIAFEFLSCNISRIQRKVDIFKPGKDHVHYVINKKVNNTFLATLLLMTLNSLICFFGIALTNKLSINLIIIIIIIFIIYHFSRNYFIKKNY